MHINLLNVFSVFMVLFAVIDITGSIPILLELKRKNSDIAPLKITLVSSGIMMLFLFLGEPFLKLFGVDLSSFAIAGSFVLFFLALELVLGIEFFKLETTKTASIVPIAFPMIAGAGSMTTLISLKSEFPISEILIGLILNMIFVYMVLRSTDFFGRLFGEAGIQILKKVFGIILLAVSIRLFLANTGITLPANA
jgi:multiple antibiotic resistance protein